MTPLDLLTRRRAEVLAILAEERETLGALALDDPAAYQERRDYVRGLDDELDRIDAAIAEGARRDEAAAVERARARQAKAAEQLTVTREERADFAAELDAAISTLESAFADWSEADARSRRLADVAEDDGPRGNAATRRAALRSAMWALAPRAAAELGVPAPLLFRKRRPLSGR